MAAGPLKLLARDSDDLKAIAAVTQDALAPVHDLAFLPGERRFVMALNRFCWENAAAATDGVYERVNCGLCFEHVARVQLRGFDLKQRDFILDLLTITLADSQVLIRFADRRDLLLHVDRLECRLDDFGEPWPTRIQPNHLSEGEWAEWDKDDFQS